MAGDPLPELLAFFRQRAGEGEQQVEGAAFRPEAEAVHDARGMKEGNGAVSEPFRRLHRIGGRQLDDEIGPHGQRHLGAGEFADDSRFAALKEGAAQHRNGMFRTGKPLRFVVMMDMTVMQRVVFDDDSDGSQGDFNSIRVVRFLSNIT